MRRSGRLSVIARATGSKNRSLGIHWNPGNGQSRGESMVRRGETYRDKLVPDDRAQLINVGRKGVVGVSGHLFGSEVTHWAAGDSLPFAILVPDRVAKVEKIVFDRSLGASARLQNTLSVVGEEGIKRVKRFAVDRASVHHDVMPGEVTTRHGSVSW
jgi:hypothetical protein